jgi:hypothetical protein
MPSDGGISAIQADPPPPVHEPSTVLWKHVTHSWPQVGRSHVTTLYEYVQGKSLVSYCNSQVVPGKKKKLWSDKKVATDVQHEQILYTFSTVLWRRHFFFSAYDPS